MAPRPPIRTLMGTWNDFGTWQRVYETAEAVEVDESNGFTGTRHRVFYDEVLLVTQHAYVGWPLAVLLGGVAACLALAALVALLAGDPRTAVTITFFAVVAAAVMVSRIAVKTHAVTIYGRRSRARVSFWLNRDRARSSYQRVCARVRHAQARAAAGPSAGRTSAEVAS